ncbi:MAG: energy-coupling factor transporter transmembrane protein EcfT [Oscillospiraceae bacterium]|nr:energy-coupling factor transporter transmembrane protein EcfT [Oscillospiraceae bacterium]
MLKDITIGQYYPSVSFVHNLDPRTKLLLSFVFIASVFIARPYNIGYAIIILMTGALYIISKIPVKMIFKGLKPIIPIIIFTVVINLLFLNGEIVEIRWIDGETVPLRWWIFKITYEGINYAVTIIIRISCLIAGTSLLTYTTRPMELTDAIETLLSPLKKIKVPVHEFAMMMTIALRFIPTLIDETDKIMSAQKARGACLDNGTLIQRAKALIPILIPLMISAFRRADELALAMECRCYNGGEGRTKFKQLRISARDMVAASVMILFLSLVIIVNKFNIGWFLV